jgi:hypothetical protein
MACVTSGSLAKPGPGGGGPVHMGVWVPAPHLRRGSAANQGVTIQSASRINGYGVARPAGVEASPGYSVAQRRG